MAALATIWDGVDVTGAVACMVLGGVAMMSIDFAAWAIREVADFFFDAE